MNNNTPGVLDGLLAQMLRRGLPVDYAQRAVAELADHHQDLVDESRAAGQDETQALAEADRRLGDPRMLVKKTVRAYQRRYWCGRWPILNFVIAPPSTLLVAWFVAGSGLVMSLRLFGIERMADIGNVFVRLGVGYMFGMTLFHIVPVFMAIGFVQYARRAACGKAWMIASGLGIGLLAALHVWFFDEHRFGFTLAFESVELFMRFYVLNPWQWMQLVLPLVVGLGFHRILESQNRRRQATEGNYVHAQRAA